MAYEQLDDEGRRIVDAASAELGIGGPPTRQTSERELHAFNQKLRQAPYVQRWLAARGKVDHGRGVQLTDRERTEFTDMLRANGIDVPKGMKVDGAGNFNQKNHLWRNVGIGAAIGGATLATMGAAGVLGGAAAAGGAGAGGGAAAGAGGVLASSSLPVGALMGGPAAITSAGISGTVGAAGAAAGGGGLTTALGSIGRREALRGLGAAAGSASDALTSNRGMNIDVSIAEQDRRAQQDRDYHNATLDRAQIVEGQKRRMFDEMLAREVEGRASGANALKQMQHAAYIADGGSTYTPRDGKSFGFGPKGASDSERQGADAFKAEVMKRLIGGNPIDLPAQPEDIAPIARPDRFTVDPKLRRPGAAETALGLGSLALDFDFIR